jgi:polyhydroxyalkanoate synthesis regulator phasin
MENTMTANDFNAFSDAVADFKVREAAAQCADFCREMVETGEMTAAKADEFANQWMVDLQDRQIDGGF